VDNRLARALQVRRRPLAELCPDARNARTHSRKQVRQIANSLKKFGWTNPILTDENGKILAGHGRLEAARLLGMKEVPTICLGGLTDDEKRAYMLADNKTAANAGWDKKLLAIEFGGLIEAGFDLEVTGFDTIEIDTLLGQTSDDDLDDEVVELPAPGAKVVTRLDDLWLCGGQKILAGDACDPASYERLLGSETAELTVTDPPYNQLPQSISGLGEVVHGAFARGSGELSPHQFTTTLLRPAFRNIANYSSAGALAFVFMDWRHMEELMDAARGVFEELKNLIVWSKTNAGMGTFYRSAHELIFAFKVSRGEHINNFGLSHHRTNVWVYPGANTFRKGRMDDLAVHPTVKNLRMVRDAILDCSKPTASSSTRFSDRERRWSRPPVRGDAVAASSSTRCTST
jgi:hypothetical protein